MTSNPKENSSNEREFRDLSTEDICCANLFYFLDNIFLLILIELGNTEPLTIIEIQKLLGIEKYPQKKVKGYLKKLMDVNLIIKKPGNETLYAIDKLGSIFIELIKVNKIETQELTNLKAMFRDIFKLIILSRLSIAEDYVSYENLKYDYNDLGSSTKFYQIMRYLSEKNLAQKETVGRKSIYKITPLGKKIVDFFFRLKVKFLETNIGKNLGVTHESKFIYKKFSTKLMHFNFSSINTWSELAIIANIYDNTSIAQGGLSSVMKQTQLKIGDHLRVLQSLGMIEEIKGKGTPRYRNLIGYVFYQNLSNIWKQDGGQDTDAQR